MEFSLIQIERISPMPKWQTLPQPRMRHLWFSTEMQQIITSNGVEKPTVTAFQTTQIQMAVTLLISLLTNMEEFSSL